jgi:hypothetical protein
MPASLAEDIALHFDLVTSEPIALDDWDVLARSLSEVEDRKMAVYMVGYDLNKPGQDYSDLFEAIKSYGMWWHHLDSTWIIVTDESAARVMNNLRQYMDNNDELLVATIGAPAAWSGFNDQGSQWLKKELKES